MTPTDYARFAQMIRPRAAALKSSSRCQARPSAQSRSQADYDAAALTRISWNISVMLEVYRSAHPRG
jgi:hypothetical protein